MSRSVPQALEQPRMTTLDRVFASLASASTPDPLHPPRPATAFFLRTALVASLLLPAIGLWAYGWASYQDTLAAASRQLDHAVGLMREHALLNFDITEATHTRIRELLDDQNEGPLAPITDVPERERRLHTRLKEILSDIPRAQAISIWNNDGRALASTRFYPLPRHLNANEADYFAAQKKPDLGMYVSGLAHDSYHSEGYLHVSHRREARDGRFMGIIDIALAARAFHDHYHENIAGDSALILTLARTDGTVLARYPDVAPPFGKLDFNPRAVDSVRIEPMAAMLRQNGDSGALSLTRKVGAMPLYVNASLARSEVLASWREQLLRTVLAVMVTAILFATLLLYALRRVQCKEQALAGWRDEIARRTGAEDALRQAQKLEAIGQLTGGVAHDFNNLLMVVNTNLHIVQLKGGTAFEREIAAIGRAVTNGQALTRQLMAFSRRQPLQIEAVRLNQCMPAICELLRHSLRPGIHLRCMVGPGTWAVEIDLSELELALLNLTVNARDAMPDGGQIDIQVGNLKFDGLLNPLESLCGEYVGIAVHDNGHGIPAEVIGRVFEPFFTTKEAGKGTGLGLAQVYGFAKQAGGGATVTSQPGQGTTFTLFLPRAGSASTAQAEHTLGSILVAESNQAVGESICALLEQLGYNVQWKHDPMEVLQALTGGGPWDLLLIDVAMTGGMNGSELVRVVRTRFPDLPIILTTGFGPSDPRVTNESLPVLTKPFDLQALTLTLKSQLNRDERQLA